MIALEGLEENFRFLVLEVTSQVSAARAYLAAPERAARDKIVSRDDYIDNLKNIVEDSCYAKIHTGRNLTKRDVDRIRGLQLMAGNLERIADYCVNLVGQVQYLTSLSVLARHKVDPLFDVIEAALAHVLEVRSRAEVGGALGICRAEPELDRLYKENFDDIMAEARLGRDVENLFTAIFIFRYLERIGDSLLNIGEALLFAVIGEKIKIEQFQALRRTLSTAGYAAGVEDIDFNSIWGTRSGCRIGKVSPKGGPFDSSQSGIFKEGDIRKMRRERENIELWARVSPGTGPRIFSYYEKGGSASMLVEFLPGCTWTEAVLTAEPEVLEADIAVFERTVSGIWRSTLERGETAVDYMQQLDSRLAAVRHVHPDAVRESGFLGGARIASTRELIGLCAAAERELPAPVSVLLHGDFNANNIVFDQAGRRVHYVDLHRTHRGDFIQDASVFLVSFFRMPVFERSLRRRINRMIGSFYDFAARFAAESGDATWQARLALGLARSFLTSTRFELNDDFAREMGLRAHYLMEGLAAHSGGAWPAYRLPDGVLFS